MKLKYIEPLLPGHFDENGCEGPAICVNAGVVCPKGFYDYKGCPLLGTVTCEDEEVLCAKGYDDRDCSLLDYCQSPFGDCPAVCLGPCLNDELPCKGQPDEAGCPTETVCKSLTMSNGCPNHCDTICQSGERLCK